MGDLRNRHCFKPIERPTPNIETMPGPTGLLTSEASGKGIVMNVARSFNNWRKFRQTVTELGRMSSRELQDLGIDRADIRSVARASVAR
jgi:uncharacterized protein YjiS (DUF1127 family)